MERAAALLPKTLSLIDELDLASSSPKLRADLRSGKLNVPGGHDEQGRAIVWLRLRFHQPKEGTPQDFGRLLTTCMLHALQTAHAQQSGVVLVNDLRGLRLSNLDPSIFRLIASSIVPRLPVRVGRIILFSPPFFFGRFVLPVVFTLLSKKLRSRIIVINSSNPELIHKYIAPTSLPAELGGSFPYDMESIAKQLEYPDPRVWERQWSANQDEPFPVPSEELSDAQDKRSSELSEQSMQEGEAAPVEATEKQSWTGPAAASTVPVSCLPASKETKKSLSLSRIDELRARFGE